MINIAPATQWLTINDVTDMTGFSKSFIYQRIKEGTFPKPLKVYGSSNRWTLEEILGWMETASQSPEALNECA
jgi:prophage regulatory protein